MWIRSQDKETLVNCNYIDLEELDIEGKIQYGIVGGESPHCYDGLATYKTKEQVLEVLDEIEEFINNTKTIEHSKVYNMPKGE